jgi:hypothetical protein
MSIEIQYKEHLQDSTCWCGPVCIFNAGDDYGRVYIHRHIDGICDDPGTEVMMIAIFKALYEDENCHITDSPEELISYDNDD